MENSTPSCVFHHHGDPSDVCVKLEPVGHNRFKLTIPACADPGDEIIVNDGKGLSRTLLIHQSFQPGGIIIVDFSRKEEPRPVRRNTNEEYWRASMEWNTMVQRRFRELLQTAASLYTCENCKEYQ
jgi:hypothetical protein